MKALRAARRRLQGANLALWLGLLLVAAVLLAAWGGPRLEALDPYQENWIKYQDGEFVLPPFPPFRVEGFPLGTDEFGRDTLARLIYGLKPTLTLVFVVATARLVIGLLLGLGAGWAEGRGRRWLEAAISAALALPVILVALLVIAARAREWGVWAFILGLTLTGWAETARLMRDQTRSLKTQPFVEAAHALGAGPVEILYRHVLPHLLPLGVVLFVFEVSHALLVTAALGFMGYFMDARWVLMDDNLSVLTSGSPELGQMLANAVQERTSPALLAVLGSAVFLMVLAFNVLGHGLREQLGLGHLARRPGVVAQSASALAGWLEARLDPFSAWRRNLAVLTAACAALLVLIGGSMTLWRVRTAAAPIVAQLPAVGRHLWPVERHDPYGTLWAPVAGVSRPQIAWTLDDADGFAGGPAVAEDGTLYLATPVGRVYALNPGGTGQWVVEAPAALWGTPALDEAGNLYLATTEGGLLSLDSAGQLRWHAPNPQPAPMVTSPIVAPSGVIYYATGAHLVARDTAGELVWQKNLPTYSYVTPALLLSPDGQTLFFEDIALDASTGTSVFAGTPDPSDGFMVSADGRVFLRDNAEWRLWSREPDGRYRLSLALRLDTRELFLMDLLPIDGAGLPDGRVWTAYMPMPRIGSHPNLIWHDGQVEGEVLSQNWWTEIPYAGNTLKFIGLDRNGTLYWCSQNVDAEDRAECQAVSPASGRVIWRLPLDGQDPVVGGALVEGRLYLATAGGRLYAVTERAASN